MENNLTLDVNEFNYDETKYKILPLHETWTWEGDESCLPYKWAHLIQLTNISEKNNLEFNLENTKKFLKDNYFGKENFDKKSFFFITNRSKVMASAYIDKDKKNIEYFLINPSALNKGEEYGLFSLVYKRIKELNLKTVTISLNNTNLDDTFFKEIGFK